MIRPVPDAAARILRKGVLCYLASAHPSGPHVTPVVFALHGSTLWVTTSRRSVKGRTWRRDDHVGGLVPAGDRTVSFAGRVVTYDLLDPGTWPRSVLHAPTLTRAAAAFSAKNARFFAGYAVDAYRVPLAWTPPGRVFAEIRFDRLAVLDRRGISRTWGRFGGRVESAHSFRMAAGRRHPLAGVPDDVRQRIGTSGDAVLAILGEPAPAVIPCRWTIERDVAYAVAPADMLSLAGGGPDVAASLTVDHASQWRARAMAGVLLQGSGRVHLVSGLRSGVRAARAIAEGAGMSPSGAFAVVRLVPHRLVWWRGWDSGTVRPT